MIKKKDNREPIDDFIINWNLNHPWDRIWREKYGVSFGSKQHREMNLLDMFIDLRENKVMKKLEDDHLKAIEEEEIQVINETIYEQSLTGNQASKRGIQMTKNEIDLAYENLNLSDFNDVVI